MKTQTAKTTAGKTGNVAPANTAVAEKDKTTTAVAVPLLDFAADAGMGMEGADKDSFAIPFLAVLQGLSPQIETVEGAKPGLLINTVTNQLMREATVVPVAFQRRYLRWEPRNEGGGFKGMLTVAAVEELIANGQAVESTDDQGTTRLMYDGDILRDTRMHYVLVLSEEGGFTPALLSMAGTQVKRSKRWMSQINGIQLRDPAGKTFTPPSFSHMYLIETEKETNEKGSWYSFVPSTIGPVTDPEVYAAAKAFHAQINAGKVSANHAEEAAATEGDGKTGGKF